MQHAMLLKSFLGIKMECTGIHSSQHAGDVVRSSCVVLASLGRLASACWGELREMQVAYRSSLDYYRRFGGSYPDPSAIIEMRGMLSELSNTMKTISCSILDIRACGWSYDEGFKSYICSISELLGEW